MRKTSKISPLSIREAARILKKGGLVAFPTETVYGLGADAFNARAAASIFKAKGRPADNPLIVHIASRRWLSRVASRLTPEAERLAKAFWPGPLTLVLPRSARIPKEVAAGLATVAVRVPAHPAALKLLKALGRPIAAPSANSSGRPSPTRARHVEEDLGSHVDLILDGGSCRWGVESTIVDLSGKVPLILRPGAVTEEELRRIVPSVRSLDSGSVRRSPGLRHKHYAPRCEIRLFDLRHGEFPLDVLGHKAGILHRSFMRKMVWPVYARRAAGSLKAYAQNLFASMREAEAAGVEILYIEAVPDRGLGRAVMDRLLRASSKKSLREGVLS